jgi:arginyl-tRNA--protein-N-Asp/Glu arginylyltransferase
MFKLNIIPKSSLPQKQTRQSTPQLTFDEKFELYKRAAQKKHEGRKLREFHFIAFEHEGFLVVVNGCKEIFAELENPGERATSIQARLVYVEVIKGNEDTEGGCYFDEF